MSLVEHFEVIYFEKIISFKRCNIRVLEKLRERKLGSFYLWRSEA